MKLALLTSLSIAAMGLAHAAEFPQPKIGPAQVGESWSYKKSVKNRYNPTVTRVIYKVTEKVGDDKLQVQVMTAEVSGNKPPSWRNAGTIPAEACLLDLGGGGTLGLDKTCSVTLVEGMDWDTEETDKNGRSKRRHEVVGTQEIRIGAGSYQATLIKADWQTAKDSDKAKPARYHFTYWYVPELRAMAKVVREFYTPAGVLEATVTEELDSFRQAPAK